MVSLQTIQKSNARIAALPPGLVAVFMGATSGIGQSALQDFVKHASSPRIYTVTRPSTAPAHQKILESLRQSNPTGTYNLITADVSLVSEIDKIVDVLKQNETKLDILFMTTGFMAFEGRNNTREGLDPSMTTRYYSRLRTVQQLLPMLNNAAASSPRIVSVLAGGIEGQVNEDDLDLKDPRNWSTWNASVHTATMGTLALEKFSRENPHLSIVHWFPGPVDTPALTRSRKFGMSLLNPMSSEEAGSRAVFLATSDCYAVQQGGLVSIPEGLSVTKQSGGGIFLINPQGEYANNELVLDKMRKNGLDEKIWSFTEKVFVACAARKD